MKEWVKITLLGILGFAISLGVCFGLGVIDLKFYKYFGTEKASIQRDIFKENKSYIEGMASDLAKYKYELSIEKDEVAQKAIKDLIRSKYSDFDIENLKDNSLKSFLIGIRGGY